MDPITKYKKELSEEKARRNNVFVFVDGTSLKGFGEFACLEGTILELDDDGSIKTCYRLFPSQWANPVGAELPPWVTDHENFDRSRQCKGRR